MHQVFPYRVCGGSITFLPKCDSTSTLPHGSSTSDIFRKISCETANSSKMTESEFVEGLRSTARSASLKVSPPSSSRGSVEVLRLSESVPECTSSTPLVTADGHHTLPMRHHAGKETKPVAIPPNEPSTSTSSTVAEHQVVRPGKRVGNLRLIEIIRVKIVNLKGLRGSSSKPIVIVAKLDNKEIHRSCGYSRTSERILDEFSHEVGHFSQLHLVVFEGGKDPNKSARPIGMVSLRRKEIARNSGKELTFPLKAVSRNRDVQGQICLDFRRDKDTFGVRVVDYGDLDLKEPQELYLLVSTEEPKDSKKLKISPNRTSDEWLEMKCPKEGNVHIKMTLWHDLLRGLNAVFHGQVRLDLPERCPNTPSKWFYLRAKVADADKKAEEKKDPSLGEMRVWMSYTADHVLPLAIYRPLLVAISESLDAAPFSSSLIALLENLPQIDLGLVARPLVQIFAYSQHIRPLLCKLYTNEIIKCQDMNTLFRSQSLAVKMLNELMRLYGKQYLLTTLKPVIDKIYKERKSCEIDPSRLRDSDSLEKNKANLLSYFTLTFERLVASAYRCPMPLKDIFSDLRDVVRNQTKKQEIERLAMSSFLIMRFFAPAILNPKFYGIKRDQPQPDTRVGRTLVLLSKILQRLANCVVSAQPLSSKEAWLDPILSQVTDETHKAAMCRYLDQISLCFDEDESTGGVTMETIAVLKDGMLVQQNERKSWRNLIGTNKKRYVMLTESDLCWQKAKGDFDPQESVLLADIRELDSNRNTFFVRSEKGELAFEATSNEELTDWVSAIERQRSRACSMNMSSTSSHSTDLAGDVDVERELEAVHGLLLDNADTLTMWKNCLEANVSLPQGAHPLPKHVTLQDGGDVRTRFLRTLDQVLTITYTIETAHREAVQAYMDQMSSGQGTKENPIGDDHYLLVKRKQSLL